MRTASWRASGIDEAALRLPGQCAVCRSWSAQALCGPCVARFAPELARCARCGLRVAVPVAACGACLKEPPPFDACIVAFDYAFPWDRLIADFKFNAQAELAAPLAIRLLHAIGQRGDALPALVLPVPLAPRRLSERGYNQAWELARRAARALSCRADARLLERPAEGAHQAELTLAQRRVNLRGAFMVDPARRALLQHRHVALVDDVMTSGATLREAALALRRAGAARVDAWVLARTAAPAD
jgi:ComF family protein